MNTSPVTASDTLVHLAAGALHLEIAPQVGGSIARFFSRVNGDTVDWMRPADRAGIAERNPQKMASFPLVPFSGRIREGRFVFAGRGITLPRNCSAARHAIHGNAWQLPWRVVESSSAAAVLVLEHARGDWPFAYRAEQRFALTPTSLEVELRVINTDAQPMPLGVGLHPYFPYTPEMTLQAKVEQMWATEHDMPISLARNDVVDAAARELKLASVTLDNNFVGWNRVATIRWPELQRHLRISATAPLSHLVVYTPPSRAFLCVEPVSNATDWLNLTHLPTTQIGGTVLAPGASVTARCRFEPGFDG